MRQQREAGSKEDSGHRGHILACSRIGFGCASVLEHGAHMCIAPSSPANKPTSWRPSLTSLPSASTLLCTWLAFAGRTRRRPPRLVRLHHPRPCRTQRLHLRRPHHPRVPGQDRADLPGSAGSLRCRALDKHRSSWQRHSPADHHGIVTPRRVSLTLTSGVAALRASRNAFIGGAPNKGAHAGPGDLVRGH